MKKLKVSSLLLVLSLLSSCGYRWAQEDLDIARPTLSVPFIQGDDDGRLTAEVIRQIGASGLASVVSVGGLYELEVLILEEKVDKIGFRIDPQKVDNKVRKNLLATEERKTLSVQATVFSRGEIAAGPFRLVADADYDFVDGDSIRDLVFTNAMNQQQTVLSFSLGQLEPVDSAALSARSVLYRRLAQKIVDAIASEW